ncbi:MAG: YihY/virulence factor BrkB family protein [Flavipsychrobacter sp.]|nr:YihY/virulence factor BrkB family protein [Flavipsychrobacter sp.]
MTQFEVAIYKWPPVRYTIRRAKKIILPGLKGASLYEVVRYFFIEIGNLKLSEKAAAVTYNFLMAMPPTFLILFSLVPYLHLSDVQKTILTTLQFITPNNNAYHSVSTIVIDFMNTQRRGFLSFGIVLVLFFSSNGVMGLMRSFDRNESLYKKRTGLQRRWTAIKLTFVLLCQAMVSLAVLILQVNKLNSWILHTFHNLIAVKIVSIVILILIVFVAISIIYTYGPSLTQKVKFISAGSIFATLFTMLITSIFFFLVNNFINYNRFYGSVGTVTAFMVWVWLNVLVILLGYELNVSLILGKLSHVEDETDTDL